MWKRYEVTFRFLTALCASMPADAEMQKKWIDARKPKNRPPDSKSIMEIAEEVQATTPEDVEPTLHIFQRHEGGLVLRMGTLRAHWKDCARVLSSLYVGKIEKEKSFAVKVVNALYYPPEVYWLPILSQATGKQTTEVTGQRDKPVHALTPQGRISAIKTFEFIEGAMLRFSLLVMEQPSGKTVIGRTDLEHLFEYGGVHGYGGERGDGEGRYVATIDEMK